MSFLTAFIDWLIAVIGQMGYLGLFIGMTIESSIVPFPSELILPPAGVLVAQGVFSFWIVLAMATLGSIAGALFNYYLAYYLGRKAVNKLLIKYGKILFVKEAELLKSEAYFRKHGEVTTFFGRLVPGIRSFVSLPAGFYKMNMFRFCLFTGLGAGLWSALLIYVGMIYGNNEDAIGLILDKFAWWIIGIVLAGLLLWWFMRRKKNKGVILKPVA